MPDYKKKYMPVVVTVYVLICLIAMGLGLAKRNANQALPEETVVEESAESLEVPTEKKEDSSASSDPLVDAASQFINQPSKSDQPVSGNMTAVLIAVVSVCFGMWLAERRKQRGQDAPSIFQLLFSRRKK